jgi:hypothetical protein
MRFSSGLTYEGAFVDDERHGQGRLTWPDGDHFEGTWVRGRRLGTGVFFCAKETKNYSQTWNENNVTYGNGAMKWP